MGSPLKKFPFGKFDLLLFQCLSILATRLINPRSEASLLTFLHLANTKYYYKYQLFYYKKYN